MRIAASSRPCAGQLLAQHRDGDVTTTSECSAPGSGTSPTCFSGPCGRRIIGALDLEALRLQRLDDVVVGDRAEQAPVDAGLLRDLHRQAVELGAAFLRLGQRVGLRLLQLGAARLERGQVGFASRAWPCPAGSGSCARSRPSP